MNCGITDVLAETPADDVAAYAPLAAQAQKLLSPAEMGELFKVIALGKGRERAAARFRARRQVSYSFALIRCAP